MEVPKWNLTDLFHNVSENYFQIYDYRIRLFFARILCWPKTLLTSWKWRHSFVKGKNYYDGGNDYECCKCCIFYFPPRKQFGIKGPLLAMGLQECFVPAILKLGLFSTRNFDRIGYHWRLYGCCFKVKIL